MEAARLLGNSRRRIARKKSGGIAKPLCTSTRETESRRERRGARAEIDEFDSTRVEKDAVVPRYRLRFDPYSLFLVWKSTERQISRFGLHKHVRERVDNIKIATA